MTGRSVIDVLLRSREPSVRWKARVQVLGEERDSRRIRALEDEIRHSSRVRALLSRRDRLGAPGAARHAYRKWQGAHWVLSALADLGYPAGDVSLAPMRDRIFELWLSPTYYQEFVARTAADAYRHEGVPVVRGRYRRCASQQGNALRFLTLLGLADARAERLAERLLHWQWPDGGWNCDRRPSADTSSFMETMLPMLGLAAYARMTESVAVRDAVDRASQVFLRRRLFLRASNGRIIDPDFVALHYPLYWHYDFLGGLIAMASIGRIRDPRCEDALDLLEQKRLPDGGWPAEKRYYRVRSRTMGTNADYVDWGGTGPRRMNEWVTVAALTVLTAAGRA
ncbi:MAG TPA: hypothetical protein VJ326_03205 [Thermoplasmata archaeon]|nr:hypothetical protein [Thermoplasmata archaeon]